MSQIEPDADSHDLSRSGLATRRQYDWTTIAPSTAVAELVADASDCAMVDIDPLYDTVDADALDSLVRHYDGPADCTLSFAHDGFSITVSAGGEVVVSPIEAER